MEGQISHSLVKALRAVPVFSSLDDRDLLHIVGASVNLHYSSGSNVFEEGSSSEALYIVLTGRVVIFTTVDGRREEIASLGPGDFFGEISLLLESTHSKTAQTTEETELMVIPTESFDDLLGSDHRLSDHVRESMAQRHAANEMHGA